MRRTRGVLDGCFVAALVFCAISVGATLLEVPRYGSIPKISLLLSLLFTAAVLEISLFLQKRKAGLRHRAWIYFTMVATAQFAASFVIFSER